ncbi:MAG: hypothetical protein FWD09_02555 [Lentimicrobiaceae bacterium]|nr:hypothetical protein [Lentimicrobiaceae bacterium]
MSRHHIHIGELILQKLKEAKRSVAWLAEKTHTDSSTLRRKLKNKSKRTEIGFVIAPKCGYYFNEKFALGLGIYVGPTFKIVSRNVAQMHFVNWSVYPFVRYTLFTYKKFFLTLEGRTGIGGADIFLKAIDLKKNKISSTLAIGVFNITPILGFNLTERLQMEAKLNFFNVGYNIDIIKEEMGSYKTNIIQHDFNIGFNSSSILEMIQLQFGVVYKF